MLLRVGQVYHYTKAKLEEWSSSDEKSLITFLVDNIA